MSTVQPLFDSIPNQNGIAIENLFYELIPFMSRFMIELALVTIRYPDQDDMQFYADMLGVTVETAQSAYDAVVLLKQAVQS